MLKIGVIGGRETVMGFKALGSRFSRRRHGRRKSRSFGAFTKPEEEFAIISIEENLAKALESEIAKFKGQPDARHHPHPRPGVFPRAGAVGAQGCRGARRGVQHFIVIAAGSAT